MKEIKRVAVLGAGTMGGGIAGACAAAGREVLLLDIDRTAGEKAKERLTAGRAPALADPAHLEKIRVGSFAADLGGLAECDWVCEAIIEDLETKREMFGEVEDARAKDSLISTNTSGIPLADICAGMPLRMQNDIAVTHFFNPVHVMKLVELVPGEHTRPETIESLAAFLGGPLGKGVVHAKDTVNFIGNRIGCLWMLAGLHLAERAIREDGLTIETVDALTAAPLGLPPTGLYGLIDLIGLDVMHGVGKNLQANLPPKDAGRRYTAFTANVQRLHDRGQLGRKSGGGFYKLTRHEDGGKSMEVFDLEADAWRAAQPMELPADEQTLPALFAGGGANARFVRELVATTLCYAADLVPEISDDIVNIDRAMRWGFNWKLGPFEMIDQLGAQTLLAHLADSKIPAPKMLRALQDCGAESFYRNDGAEFLTAEGKWERVAE